MPKVSVIIPVYNVEKYLERCLNSIVGQTLRDIEIICVNDGSTDGSDVILEKYAARDNRIKLVAQENKGVAIARNQGIKAATGEYLSFIDPDDSIDLNFYEVLCNKAEKENADITKGALVVTLLNGEKKSLSDVMNKTIVEKTKFAFTYQWVSAIYKASMIFENDIKFNNDLIQGEDGVFLIRTLLASKKVTIANDTTYHYHRREGSLDSWDNASCESVKSGINSKKIIMNYLNNSDLPAVSLDEYIYSYSNVLMSIFHEFFRTKDLAAKEYCIQAFIEYAKKCKDIKTLKETSKNKWIFDYKNEKQTKELLERVSKNYKNSVSVYNDTPYKKKQSFLEKIFSVRNEMRPNKKYKVVTVFGVRLKFKIKVKDSYRDKVEYWKYKKPDFKKRNVIRLNKEFDKFWEKIENGENFALLRYGDGERAMMTGESVKAQEGWQSPNGIGKLGLDLIATLDLKNENVYYGISCPCYDPEAYYWYSSRIKSKNRTFANLWVNKNYRKFIKHFNKLKRDAVLIANYRAKGAKIGNLNILAHYEIGDDCVSFWENEAPNLIQKIKNDWGNRNNILYVVSAGPMAEPIIAELYKNNPNNCYIDFGSVLDEYYKEVSRPYMIKGTTYAERNCWMDNPNVTNFDVSVVLNLYKRPENLKLQLDAIEVQSLKPKEIILYQDGAADGSKVEIPEDIKNRFDNIVISNENKGVWERFRVAKEYVSSKYVCVFDDDTIPGSRWLENCHFEMLNKEGLYGTIGILTNNIAAYPIGFDFFRAGWDNPLDGTVEVDLVGHSWFFKREWLEDLFSVPEEIQKFKIVGEDMGFSYALLKNRGVKTFVPPHPKNKLDFFGSNPMLAYKLGTSKCAISMNNDNYKAMNNAVKILLDNGWKTLEKRNPLYIEHVKVCIQNGEYADFSFLQTIFLKLFNIYNKNNRKIIKISGIKISLRRNRC